MRRLFIGVTVVTFAGAITQCAGTTELVVVVDTDLVPGAEVDSITVSVDGPTRRVFERGAEVRAASSLPLTLGIAAGSSDDAAVHVIATAFKDGGAIARTEVIARFVPGESRLLQVSICKSCGLTCGRNLGTSLPEWNEVLPPSHACETTFADAGGFDAGRDDAAGSDAPNTVDVGVMPPNCLDRCGHGSECANDGGCRITGAATCADPVAVGPDGGAFFGTLCTDAGTYGTGCGSPHFGFVFETANAGDGHAVVLSGVQQYGMTGGALESSCTRPGGCSFPAGGSGDKRYPDAPPASLYGIGFRPNVDGGACQTVTLTFTPK